MADRILQIGDRRIQILVVGGVLIVLGSLAWGMGWAARSLLTRQAMPLPTATVGTPAPPTATASPVAPTPAGSLPSPPVVHSTSTPQPTSTPMPTSTPAHASQPKIVKPGEGLYQVCRRHCPGRWSADDIPPDLIAYAKEVARLNRLPWPPELLSGQELQMPPCP